MLYADWHAVCCVSALKHGGRPGSSAGTGAIPSDSDLVSSGSYLIVGSGSYEQDGPLCIVAIGEEKQTGGRSMSTDLENDNLMRTKRASRWRSVLFQRSTWALSPVSLPTAVCCSRFGSPPQRPPRKTFRSAPADTPLEWLPTIADTFCRLRSPTA